MSALKVTATTRNTTGVVISSGSVRLELDYSDRPGRETLCPVELLTSALAGCVSLTIRAVAETRGFPLDALDVTVATDPDYGRPSRAEHRVDIALHGDLSDKERTILFRSAKACHVHKLLGGENSFFFALADEGSE